MCAETSLSSSLSVIGPIQRATSTPRVLMTKVSGRPVTPYSTGISRVVSSALRYVTPTSFRNWVAEDGSSQTSIPRTVTPRSPNRSAARCNAGASIRQGGHHDAQKFKMTTRPRKSESRRRWPSKDVRWKSGAGRSFTLPCWPIEMTPRLSGPVLPRMTSAITMMSATRAPIPITAIAISGGDSRGGLADGSNCGFGVSVVIGSSTAIQGA